MSWKIFHIKIVKYRKSDKGVSIFNILVHAYELNTWIIILFINRMECLFISNNKINFRRNSKSRNFLLEIDLQFFWIDDQMMKICILFVVQVKHFAINISQKTVSCVGFVCLLNSNFRSHSWTLFSVFEFVFLSVKNRKRRIHF